MSEPMKDSKPQESPEQATPAPEPAREAARVKPQASSALAERTESKRPPLDRLPPFKVLLHNDSVNSIDHVVETILELTPLDHPNAVQSTLEAHASGLSLLLVTHQERAELYREQFATKNLTVTIEPAE